VVGLSLVGLMAIWTGHYLGGFAGPNHPSLGRTDNRKFLTMYRLLLWYKLHPLSKCYS
jgi:hypothetical protein